MPSKPNPQLIYTRIPWALRNNANATEEECGKPISEEMTRLLLEELGVSKVEECEKSKVARAWDRLILHQTATLGLVILTSEPVKERIMQWQIVPEGPGLLAKWGKALEKAALIMQRRCMAPIDADEHLLKEGFKEEILRAHRLFRADTKKLPKDGMERFAEIILSRSEECPALMYYLDSLKAFWAKNPHWIEKMAMRDHVTYAAMYDEWRAQLLGSSSPVAIAQRISKH